MKIAEYDRNIGCPQRDSAEHEENTGARSAEALEGDEQDGADLMERVLSRENLNRAYRQVRSNHGAAGIGGMKVGEALPWLKEHRGELLESIRTGKYKPSPVRRIEKSKVVSVFAVRNFKYLGFALGKGRNGVYVRVHAKSLKKARQKLKELTSRSQGRNVRAVMKRVKIFAQGWLGYFGIASMKTTMQRWDEWLRRRLRMYIWKQWKKPKTRIENLKKLGMPEWQAYRNGYTRKGYWRIAGSGILNSTITNKRLARAGYYSFSDRYKSLHSCD